MLLSFSLERTAGQYVGWQGTKCTITLDILLASLSLRDLKWTGTAPMLLPEETVKNTSTYT